MVPPTTAAPHARALAETPYARLIGVEIETVRPERVRLRLPHRETNGNRNGSLHGGVLASLVLLGGTLATAAAASKGEPDAETTTIDLTVQYLAPAVREAVIAEAVVARRGREIVFTRVAVDDPRGAPIALGLVATRTVAGRRARPGPAVTLPEVPPDAVRRLRASGSPFSAALGVRSARLSPGEVVALLPEQPAIAARGDRLAEGALATLADCAAGAAAWSVEGYDARGRAATVGMHLAFAAGRRGEEVAAHARAAWQSAGLFVCAVTIAGRPSGQGLATGAVTYRIDRP